MKNINSSDVGSTGSNFSEWFEKEIHEPMKLHANYGSEYLDTHLAAIKVLTGAAFKAGESAQLKMMEWQPIETALKSWASILCVDKGEEIAVCFYGKESDGYNWDGWWVDNKKDLIIPFFPTHWMPLPSPPAC